MYVYNVVRQRDRRNRDPAKPQAHAEAPWKEVLVSVKPKTDSQKKD